METDTHVEVLLSPRMHRRGRSINRGGYGGSGGSVGVNVDVR